MTGAFSGFRPLPLHAMLPTMTGTISKEHRSWNMSRIRSTNTRPEMIIPANNDDKNADKAGVDIL